MKKLIVTAVLLAPLLALAAGKAERLGGKVTVLGVWGGTELDTFNAMVKPFQERTGVQVEFEATRDLDAVLTTRVAAGNPPDLAVLPSPGKMADLARQGKLVDLAGVLDLGAMKKSYAQGWLDLGSVDGKLVGIFPKADLKGLIWYDPKVVKAAGLSASPRSFADLMAEANAAAAKGVTPFAIGIESGAASGWVGTDWIENIFLKTYGPAKYKQWYEGKLAWTSPELKSVFQTWGQIVGNPKLCFGGSQYILSTNFGTAFTPLFETPPKAYFHFQATFIQGFITKQFPALKAGEDFSFFAFPPIKPEYTKSAEISGDLVGMFRLPQRPQQGGRADPHLGGVHRVRCVRHDAEQDEHRVLVGDRELRLQPRRPRPDPVRARIGPGGRLRQVERRGVRPRSPRRPAGGERWS